MKQELIKYAEGLNCNQTILDWLEKNVDETKDQSEVEHIIDYLVSDKAPARLDRATYNQVKSNAEKWTKSLEKKGAKIKETKKDIEVVLDFKDGFKIVKLVGENAYKREGFLMRHCVSQYYDKNDEIYSLRDKNNMPHATMSKSSQQIKGKGNGNIHPKYVEYIVKFLEHLGIDVRENEMKNLGYVNIENIKDENAIFPKKYLFKEKYFRKEDVKKIVDKSGNRYENITLWKDFGVFDFNTKLNVEMLFSLKNCINNFRKLVLENKKSANEVAITDNNKVAMTSFNKVAMTSFNKVAMTNSNKVAMDSSNEVAMTDNNKVAMTDNNEVAMTDNNKVAMTSFNKVAMHSSNEVAMHSSNEVAMTYNNKVAMTDNNKVAMTDNNKVAMTRFNEVAMTRFNKVAMDSFNKVAMTNSNKVAMDSSNEVAMTDSNKVAMTDNNEVAMDSSNEIKCKENNLLIGRSNNKVEIGFNSIVTCAGTSKVKGKIGSWISLIDLDNTNIIKNVIVKKIDGKELKEDTWYTLKDGEVVEVMGE